MREIDADAIRSWRAADPVAADRFDRWLTESLGQPVKAIESVAVENRNDRTVLTVVHRVLNQRGQLRPGEQGAMHTRKVRVTVETPPPAWPVSTPSPTALAPPPWPPPAGAPEV